MNSRLISSGYCNQKWKMSVKCCRCECRFYCTENDIYNIVHLKFFAEKYYWIYNVKYTLETPMNFVMITKEEFGFDCIECKSKLKIKPTYEITNIVKERINKNNNVFFMNEGNLVMINNDIIKAHIIIKNYQKQVLAIDEAYVLRFSKNPENNFVFIEKIQQSILTKISITENTQIVKIGKIVDACNVM